MSLHLGAQPGDLVGKLSIHRSTTRLHHWPPQPLKYPIEGLAEAATIGLVFGVEMARDFHAGYSRNGGVNILMPQTNHRPIRSHDKGARPLTSRAVGARVNDNDPPSVTPRWHGDDVPRIKARQ